MRAGVVAGTTGAVALVLVAALFGIAGREFVVRYEPASPATAADEVAIQSLKSLSPPPRPHRRPGSPLADPPPVVKAVYATSWSAGSRAKIDYLIDLIRTTELNAIVIDIKDYSGVVGYETALPQVKQYGAEELRISDISGLIEQLHAEKIYVIGRLAVFQDQKLAVARPELALKDRTNGGLWRDRKGLAWIDPVSEEAWAYNAAIARDALELGFDEINFDYIRFASDGVLADIVHPFWNASTTLRTTAIESFFQYLAKTLPPERISADLFGLVTVDAGDLGIGQQFERALPYFGAVAPMMYPSHYQSGFSGFKNPAEHPYEVVRRSVGDALARFNTYDQRRANNASTTTPASLALSNELLVTGSESSVIRHQSFVRLRPWLQDFDLGADYDAVKVRAQIAAVYDAFEGTPPALTATSTATTTPEGYPPVACDVRVITDPRFGGWMLWNPSNRYTRDALCL